MNTQDIFCGTKSMAKVAIERGHECLTLDVDERFEPDIVSDILETDPGYCQYAHFSPPCTGFSVASIGKCWNRDSRTPKSKTAREGVKILHRVAELIAKNGYDNWTVENPRGMFRKVFPDILKSHGDTDFRLVTVTYCQYGDDRMKPTDFITNIKGWFGKSCKNGDDCHVPAPRGSRTGTQGVKGSVLRGVIPSGSFTRYLE